MAGENQLSFHHSNQYSAESACGYCDGVIRHESWCATQSALVHYAFQAVLNPAQLTLRDELILHGVGVAWTADEI